MTPTLHDYYLNNLIHHFDKVDENINGMEWIMKDGIYLKKDSNEKFKLCDLIIGLYDKTGLLIELKGSKKKKSRAIPQLYGGDEVLRKMGYDDNRMKIVYYINGKYEFEEIKNGNS